MNTPESMVLEFQEKYNFDSPKVIDAMIATLRDKFIHPKYKEIAYDDRPIDIGYGQTMSQPYTVAFMTDLMIAGKEYTKWKVLEIGTGSGYQAAVLSKLVKEVYTVEIVPELATKSRKTILKLGYKNVHVKMASGEFGWKNDAPYDGIIVTAGVEGEVPRELFEQLKTGGVLVIPVGDGADKMMIKYIKDKDGKVSRSEHGVFHFVPFVRE